MHWLPTKPDIQRQNVTTIQGTLGLPAVHVGDAFTRRHAVRCNKSQWAIPADLG
jgi:hypothetical protein